MTKHERKGITAIDIAIGCKIHQARTEAKASRLSVANLMGLSHQQLHKYESGQDRITAGRLAALAKILKKPIAYFYEDAEKIIANPAQQAKALAELR